MAQSSTGLSRRTMLAMTGGAVLAGGMSAAPFGGTVHAAAPMLGDARPTHFRFKLGDFEITTLHDGAIVLDGPHPIFGNNVSEDEVKALAEENHLPPAKLQISFTPIVVNTGTNLVLFDSGNGAARRPDAGKLVGLLGDAGFNVGDIDTVVISHFHPDHIGGLIEGDAPLFPNASIYTSSTEYDFWAHDDRLSGATEAVATLTRSNVVPQAERITFVEDGSSVVSGITMLGASGHTPGHCAIHVESVGKRFVFIADACNHFVMSMQRPDWHVKFDMDKDQAAATRKSLLGMIAADGIPFAGYHMPFPAVGYVEAAGSGFRYVPATYQFDV